MKKALRKVSAKANRAARFPRQVKAVLVHPSSLETPWVCANCRALQINTENFAQEQVYHSNFIPPLSQSDCEVCRILWNSIIHYFPESLRHSSIQGDIQVRYGQLNIKLQRVFAGKESTLGDYGFHCIMLHRCSGIPCPWSIFPAPRNTSIEVLISGSIGRARYWLNQCDRRHDCQTSDNRKLPFRLLHLGRKDSKIRLLETKHEDRGKYACLSHCWGEPKSMEGFKTTRKNYSNRLQSIPWSQIPRTFRDAIIVARALDIGYLWIDSICILQDDPDDWNREAANMHSIYENSYITIGATSSDGPNGGLYLQERSDNFQDSGTTSSGEYFSVIGRVIPKHPAGQAYQGDEGGWPLLRRAWVLQERLLSPRFLHFTCHEMIWECKRDISCECGNRRVEAMSIKQSLHKAFDDHKQIAEAWRQVVTSYSMLKLTEESDKLPALSGLAAKVATRRPGSDYFAGLWSDTIHHDLLWSVPGWRRKDARRPSKWRAPTWSWASLNSPVEFPLRGAVTRLYQTIEVKTSPATGDKLGQVTKGSLTIRGLLFSAKVEMKDYTKVWMILKDRRYVPLRRNPFDFPPAIPRLDTMNEWSLKDCALYYLRIARLGRCGNQNRLESEHTLILRLIQDSGKFERIGIVSQEAPGHDNERFAKFWASDENPFAQGGEERTVEII